ncbi:phage envelope protein [Flavobacterium akiainvivens]|uniref:Phage envelope protein n=1 Tax=Flavobacterium akiainvivens TaxID=1202724 RepID=A0A0M9VIP8_9FLAO|nr:DUF1398 family protein [Flavobacterium akiainvivens]KOS06862.1 phage envelope protein [Flavobacterium akiainvivens]SFQ69262.1 Uncharacterized conserved protein YbcV, DUF1398 family [Flavobacterium akiainvivens]
MFTTEQISQAHSKVKSGADFPAYIRNLKALGVLYYETFVHDGHAVYYGTGGFKTASQPKYEPVAVAGTLNLPQFKADLKLHQQGGTDYATFISHCAQHGIVKWAMDLEKMTCTYFDAAGNEVLTEQVPG